MPRARPLVLGLRRLGVLDLVLPELDGLAIQGALRQTAPWLPVIFMSGLAQVEDCAAAMKAGALDFLEKPVGGAKLRRAVEEAIARSEDMLQKRARVAELTGRQREVLRLVATGLLNKQIADELGVGEHTVKIHRARGLARLRVGSVAELVDAWKPLLVDRPA